MPMIRSWFAKACGVLLAAIEGPVSAADTDLPIRVEVAQGERGDPWPVTPVAFGGGVRGFADIIYDQLLHHRPLRLDLYRPAGEGPWPLVLFVHGGAWMAGTKRDGGPMSNFPEILANLSARGFVVASAEYRLDGEGKFPVAIRDVKNAIRFLRRNARRYGIDPARVGVWGPSAGGQLAALAATSCGVKDLDPVPPRQREGEPGHASLSDCVQAAVAWYGVYDFATVPTPRGQPGPSWYLGCPSFKCPDAMLRRASPATYVDKSDPPMLLIHGTADDLVAPAQTTEFHDVLKAAGVPVEVLMIPDVDHGLVGKAPEVTRAANLRALEVTFDYFDRTLGGQAPSQVK